MSVLVTGATGFIGRHLVARLLERGEAVVALVLPEEGIDPAWADRVRVVRGDVTDPAAAARALEGAGTVFHLAAVVGDWAPETLFERVTVGGTRNVLAAAARAGTRAVLASSIVVYGDSLGRAVCDEDRPFGRPLGPYGRSKQAQELVARELARTQDLALSVVRPANVYGPGSRPWVEEVLVQMRRGRPVLVGGGRQRAGLCAVDHAVDVLVAAAEAPAGTFNACDGSEVTWATYFGDLARIAGLPPPRSIPRPAALAAAAALEPLWRWTRRRNRPPITREALNLVGSDHRVPIDRARRDLGFVPRPDAYERTLEGIARSIG